MSNNALVSIVIPVYNTAQYLVKCVQSVLEQTYPHFELILVDDGSTDDSPQLCDELAQQDERVRVLHQANGGQAAARNAGVQFSCGESVMFVDSDDLIAADLLETLVSLRGQEPDATSIVCVMDVRECETFKDDTAPAEQFHMSPEEACETLLYQTLFDTGPIAKLIPRNIVLQHPFPVGRIYEDLARVYLWLLASRQVTVSTRKMYYYIHRTGSTVRQGFSERYYDEQIAIDSVYDHIEKEKPALLAAAISRRFSCYCHLLLLLPREKTYFEKRTQLKQVLRKDCSNVVRNPKCRRKNRLAALVYLLAGEFGLRLSTRFLNAR